MTKIKIDFFIMPKVDQENRSAKFIIQDINSNKTYVKYFQKTDEMSIKNIQDSLNTVNNISGKIDDNTDNMASNLQKMNNIKKLYLKNVHNILTYDQKTQINFQDTFYEKIFDLDSKKNNFIEVNFELSLEYQDTDDRHYVKTDYKIFDENNNNLFEKQVTNNDYIYYSNKLIIDENIFYNFISDVKKIKFVIRFKSISSSRVIKIFYIKNDNYRLILKNYST